MKAIILAAGLGSRLMPLTKDKPKCLLTIGDETILSRQIRILRKYGIHHIVIIVGYKREQIVNIYTKEKDIIIIANSRYKVTSDAVSVWMARDAFDDDIVLINGDIVFTEMTIKDLLNDNNPFSISVEKKMCELDDVKVVVKNDLIIDVGKGIPLKKAYGEAVGIGKINKEKLGVYRQSLCKNIKDNPQLKWLEVFKYLANDGERIHLTLIKEPCFENDTLADYLRTKEIFSHLR